MEKSFKPKGYNSLSAYFVVERADEFIHLMQELFGASLMRKFDDGKGNIVHAELRIDDTIIMLGQSNERTPPRPQLVHLYVPDVDKVFEKASSMKLEIVDNPRTRPGDPDKRGALKDSFGNFWSIATQMEE